MSTDERVASDAITALPRRGDDGGTCTLSSVNDTVAFGEQIGRQLRAGDVVVLCGPLGAGKTLLAKGIAQGMAVAGPVTSPTYVLARVHRACRVGDPAMVHVDLYRLRDQDAVDVLAELDSLDLDTDIADCAVVVEWGQGVAERLSPNCLHISLQRRTDNEERIAWWRWQQP